jgi:hypothetical protein
MNADALKSVKEKLDGVDRSAFSPEDSSRFRGLIRRINNLIIEREGKSM